MEIGGEVRGHLAAVRELTVTNGCRHCVKESVAMVAKSTSTKDFTTSGRSSPLSVKNLTKMPRNMSPVVSVQCVCVVRTYLVSDIRRS